MKKLLIFLITLMFTSAAYAEKITEQQALQKAQQFFREREIISNNPRRAANLEQQKSPTQEDYYIFNVENKGGFVIISGDDRTPEVLGYSDSGNIDMDNLPPNLKEWLEGYSKQMRSLETVGNTTRRSSSRASNAAIEPLITTQWGQEGPYNSQCPVVDGKHCVTGCVATAMAQVMYYHKWPQEPCAAIPQYTTGTRQIEMPALPPTTFNWNAMRDRYYEGEQGESADAVAELMRYCGQAVEMNYDVDESGSGEAPWHFVYYFGYGKNAKFVQMSQYTISQWEDILYNELSEGRPMLYCGANYSEAHEFICDGYAGDGYFHFNWGWAGTANGYFLLSILYNGFSGGYILGQQAIIGLQPDNGESATPYVYSYLGEDLTQTEYVRSSVSEDFSDISLTEGAYIQYEIAENQDVSLDYGLGLYKDTQLITILDQSSAILNINSNIIYKQTYVAFGKNMEDGEYQIRTIYKLPENNDWETCADSYVNYIVATISANNLTLREVGDIGTLNATYTVNSVSVSDHVVTINITNTGYTNQEMVYLWMNNGGRVGCLCGTIEHGKTGDVKFALEGYDSFSAIISADINRQRIMWEGPISFPERVEQQLTCSGISIDNFNNDVLMDSELRVRITITNTGENIFDDVICCTLNMGTFTNTGYFPSRSSSQQVALNVGETKDIEYVLSHLEDNREYGLYFTYFGKSLKIFDGDAIKYFLVAKNTIENEGLTFAYSPKSKTASVIPGDYQEQESITIPSTITVEGTAYSVTEIASNAFKSCHIKSITLPEGVIAIGNMAFGWYSDLEEISLPSTLKSIGQNAFMASKLKELAIPEGVNFIGGGAFWSCRDLEILKLPSTLTSIEGGVISDCDNLKFVYSAMTNPIEVTENTFASVSNSVTLYVPKGSVSKYQETDGWNAFARITDKLPYKLTYYVDGEVYKSYEIEEETAITAEEEPTKDGYTFSGWSEIPETMPDHDVTVTGTFVRVYNVGDVVNVVNFIMNANAQAADIALYDMNNDNELNIGDIILIVKWILNNAGNGGNAVRRRASEIIDITQYTAAQFGIKLPATVKIKNIRLVNSMNQSHQIMYKQLDEQTYAVVVYSPTNQLMIPDHNDIVIVETEGTGIENLTIQNTTFAKPNGEITSYEGSFVSTGIESVHNDEGSAVIYDLRGNRLDNGNSHKKGVYIVNGKKVVVK